MSEVSKAAEALAAGRRDDALGHGWNAARAAGSQDLPQLARLAAQLDDPALVAAIAVRRLRSGASRRWWIGEKLSTAVVLTLGFTWWLGWSLLVTLATMSNRVAAVLISIVAAVLIVIGLDKGWLQTDGEDGE